MKPIRYALAALALAAIPVVATPAHADSSWTIGSGRPFTTTSPWNAPIGAYVNYDPNSSAMASWLATGGTGVWAAAIYDYGFPAFDGQSTDGTKTIHCTASWGTCPSEGVSVHVPSGTAAAAGSDAAMEIVDWPSGNIYDFWQVASITSTTITASWSTHTAASGDGGGATDSGATGAGINALAGVVRTYEIVNSNGNIDAINHALTMGTANSCTNAAGGYRTPASKTDGSSSASNCIPEGARVQLSPSVNCSTISAGYGVKAVCKALQVYGAYVRDNSGAHIGVSFENPNGGSDPYSAAGLSWDSYDLSDDITALSTGSNLRVLSAWNASASSDVYAPWAPPSFTITGTTSTTASMSWGAAFDNVAVTGYQVWQGDGNWANWVQVGGTLSAGTLSYQRAGLLSGHSYTFCVRALDAASNVSASSTCPRVTLP